ncbi:MAG TPA: sigma-70 family RNA polymerase sigma factor [Candidatus Polarisedimenticolia bacterium]|jgi:RNA polymerase sigma factor (TIGR02999 family)|nr:sigma-70 family RNA polymerase sigma factor [Candidatus Polarisedimenticolia bacterium]
MTGGPVTELLVRWRQGDAEALEAIVPLVYKELHDLAHGYLRREHPGHTLQSMALVHEAYLRLVDQKPLDINDRSHFIAVAARLMRQILVDHARSRGAAKRGAGLKVGLSAAGARADARAESALEIDLMALDDALTELARLDERQGKIVELRYFGGMTNEEVALALGISPATVKREWTVAKAWLSRRIRKGAE